MTDYEQIQQMLALRPDADADLDNILVTAELLKRPSRAPDYRAENEALTALAQELAAAPSDVLQKLCAYALKLCSAHAAGVSIEEEAEGMPIFRQRALAGEPAPDLHAITPRDLSPCGVAADRNAPQLFSRPERYYPYLQAMEPPIVEMLIIPFRLSILSIEEKRAGTLWVVSSKEDRRFDQEDARILTNLSRFANAAYRAARAEEDMRAAGVQLAAEDARHQEKAEKETLLKTLEVERARLTSLFMQAPAFIAVTRGPEHVFERVNPPYCQLVGHRDLIGKTVREAFPEIEGQGFFEILNEVYRSGKPFIGKDMRILFQEEAGAPLRERFLDFVYQPLIEADGSVSGIFAHGVDLTERKQAEQALQESEVKMRSLFENAREAIGIASEGKIAFVNPAYARLLGYASPEEMIGVSVLEPVAPADRERLTHLARRRNAGEEVPFSYEYRGRKKDGAECDLENYVSKYELNGKIYTVVTTRDITARKQQEVARQFLSEASAALASSLDYEQTLQQVADLAVPHIADWCGVDMLEEDGAISQLAVAHVDPEKVKWGHELRKSYPPDLNAARGLPNVLRTGQAEIYADISDELLVAGARDQEHLELMRQIGLDSLMIVPMVARERILGAITFVATDESGHHYTEADLELAEGLAARAALAIDNARLYRAAQEELTERRRVQEALHASEERFRFALANSSIIVYTQDCDLRYTWVYNGALNSEESAVYGKTDAEIMANEDAVPLMEIKRRVLQSGIEERHIIRATPTGQAALYLDTSFAPLRDAAETIIGITGTANDITERKKAQDVLAQHQAEIEALNVRLQRSMRETHHRVKNNLQVITALINMQQMQYEDQVPSEELQRLTQHIRALASIHDLLTHQAQTDAEVSDISIQDMMGKLMPAVQGMAAGRSITFAAQDMRLPIRQSTTFAILVNELVSNAIKHGAGEIHVDFSVEGDTARLEALDEGPGFPANFNPISAANTGLDLIDSLARMDMRGSVRYENRETGGARVLVEFPVPPLTQTSGE